MIVVVDSNILFSALLNPSGTIGLKFIFPGEKIIYIAPEFLKKEVWKHKERLKKIGNFNEQEFDDISFILLRRINFYSEEIFSEYIHNHTLAIMKDGDLKDIPFVGMALFFQVKIWTGDLKLSNYLKSKGLDICVGINDL